MVMKIRAKWSIRSLLLTIAVVSVLLGFRTSCHNTYRELQAAVESRDLERLKSLLSEDDWREIGGDNTRSEVLSLDEWPFDKPTWLEIVTGQPRGKLGNSLDDLLGEDPSIGIHSSSYVCWPWGVDLYNHGRLDSSTFKQP